MKARMEVLLSLWGRWSLRSVSGGLGFPSVSPMFKDAPRGDSYGSVEPLGFGDADMQAIDASIRRLPSLLRLVVIEVYQYGGSIRKVAGRMGISHTAVRNYLDQVHEGLSIDMDANRFQNTLQMDRVHQCALPKTKPAAA